MNRIPPGANPVGRVVGAYGEHAKVKKAPEAGKSSPGKTDKVELSVKAQRAQEVRRLLELMPESDGVSLEKVEALRQAIESGTYKPDYRAVAEKLLKQRVVE